jgi:hypothetical protein
VLVGRLTASQGPASLAAAITRAAAGEFPCGNTSTLPGALKSVCGASTAQSPTAPAPKRAAAAGARALHLVFGAGAVLGRVSSVTSTQITLGGPKKPVLLDLTASTKFFALRRSTGPLTMTPVTASAVRPGVLVVVVQGPPGAVGYGRTALYVYLLGGPAAGTGI